MKICDVIKCENMGDTLIYKFPEEDFNTLSQLTALLIELPINYLLLISKKI